MPNAVQISYKQPDGSIYVVGGDDFDDFYQNLIAAMGGKALADEVWESFQAAARPSVTGQQRDSQSRQQQQSRQSNQRSNGGQRRSSGPPPGEQAPVCEHGWDMEWKTGVSEKNGRTWKGWFCTADREDACPPQWVR